MNKIIPPPHNPESEMESRVSASPSPGVIKNKGLQMKWLEELHIRFSKNDYEHLKSEFDLLKKKLKKENNTDLTLYHKAGLNSDIKLYIEHHSDKLQTEGSALGLHIKAELENYGIVNHSVWVKVKK